MATPHIRKVEVQERDCEVTACPSPAPPPVQPPAAPAVVPCAAPSKRIRGCSLVHRCALLLVMVMVLLLCSCGE